MIINFKPNTYLTVTYKLVGIKIILVQINKIKNIKKRHNNEKEQQADYKMALYTGKT